MKQPNPETPGDLGDIPAEAFRKHLHEVADWIADYRENIAQHRISPTAFAASEDLGHFVDVAIHDVSHEIKKC